MQARIATFVLAAFVTVVSTAQAKPLDVGDPAPALTVGKWLKGEPIKEIEKGKLHLIEFWATWCPECIEQFPKLSAIAKDHPAVVVIGASVWETDQAAVEPFVAEMTKKMSYHVAMDDVSNDVDGALAKRWLNAAGQEKLPVSFVIDGEGTIRWIGDVAGAEKMLQQLEADDGAQAQQPVQVDEKELERLVREDAKMREEYDRVVEPQRQVGDFVYAAATIDKLIQKYPDSKAFLLGHQFDCLMRAERFDLAYAVADQFAVMNHDNADQLNALAWYIADEDGITQRDLDRAMRYANRAVDLTRNKNGAYLDTLARVYFEKGEVYQAIDLQAKALEVATPIERNELMSAMARYQAALPK